MVELISSILQAEQNADKTIKDAQNSAKKIILDADTTASKIINSAIGVQKIHRIAVLKDAEIKAEEEYNKIIEVGQEKAKRIYDDACKNFDNVSDDIVKSILG